MSGSGDESAVVTDHAEEALELLDGSRRLEGPDLVDAVGQRGDAAFVQVFPRMHFFRFAVSPFALSVSKTLLRSWRCSSGVEDATSMSSIYTNTWGISPKIRSISR